MDYHMVIYVVYPIVYHTVYPTGLLYSFKPCCGTLRSRYDDDHEEK
jgi:hypothetical protein